MGTLPKAAVGPTGGTLLIFRAGAAGGAAADGGGRMLETLHAADGRTARDLGDRQLLWGGHQIHY